jgi:hypothetical protein
MLETPVPDLKELPQFPASIAENPGTRISFAGTGTLFAPICHRAKEVEHATRRAFVLEGAFGLTAD